MKFLFLFLFFKKIHTHTSKSETSFVFDFTEMIGNIVQNCRAYVGFVSYYFQIVALDQCGRRVCYLNRTPMRLIFLGNRILLISSSCPHCNTRQHKKTHFIIIYWKHDILKNVNSIKNIKIFIILFYSNMYYLLVYMIPTIYVNYLYYYIYKIVRI